MLLKVYREHETVVIFTENNIYYDIMTMDVLQDCKTHKLDIFDYFHLHVTHFIFKLSETIHLQFGDRQVPLL